MSLASLVGEDTITVQTQVVTKDASGAPKRTFSDLYTGVPARVEDMSANEITAFAMKQMNVSNRVFTFQSGIANKHLLVTSDGRTIQVEGVRKMRGIGGMETFYEIVGQEIRPGA